MGPLWTPSEERVNSSEMTRFQNWLSTQVGKNFSSYSELHDYSIRESDAFWSHLLDYYQVKVSGDASLVCEDYGFSQYGWFPNLKLNFAENLLRHRESSDCALHFIHESSLQKKISYQQLYRDVSCLQQSLKGLVNKGDVLAAYMPNLPETAISMLACTSLGGVFTSTSADFGIEGVVDRFGQSKPKVLVTVSSYEYNGKRHSLIPKLKEITSRLEGIEKVIIVNFLNDDEDISEIPGAISWSDFLSTSNADEEIDFTPVAFDDPLYIMYSSGTTGKPKCIVHSTGGTLLQHIKELGLHSNLNKDKSIFFFTTCGWMMWNWLISSLYFGSRVCLYEGSPSYPSLGEYFEVIKREEINIFGTSPKFLRALEDSGYRAPELPSLETILSTGAPLMSDQYEYIYRDLKEDVMVSSISGGTDILGCFMLGNPNLAVYAGEIQCAALAMAVDSFKSTGESQDIGVPGELVCTKSFPSRPLYFLGDEDGKRIKGAYFDQFPNTWAHGDFIEKTEHGGIKVHGRSDATLNPGGVRIGTAEIYRQVEGIEWVEDCLCVGLQEDGDVSVVLFIKMAPHEILSDERITQVKKEIRSNTTPRHVPKYVSSISDIPYTRSGKKMELVVTHILAGREIKNIEAIANPESLSDYREWTKSLS